MSRYLLSAVMISLLIAPAAVGERTGIVPSQFVRGTPILDIDIIDERGRVRSTREWSGTPTIIAPLYTRCPVVCPMIVQAVKKGVAGSSASPADYRVVLFSFDPRDTPRDLQRLRRQQNVPIGWTIAAAAKKGDARRLLDGIGYHYGEANGHFTHPAAIISITADGKAAAMLTGTSYDIDVALASARGANDWIDRYGGWMLAVLLFIALLSVIYLATMVNIATRGPANRVAS